MMMMMKDEEEMCPPTPTPLRDLLIAFQVACLRIPLMLSGFVSREWLRRGGLRSCAGGVLRHRP
jgi:hypothetical protein